jgi:hypothetical protein
MDAGTAAAVCGRDRLPVPAVTGNPPYRLPGRRTNPCRPGSGKTELSHRRHAAAGPLCQRLLCPPGNLAEQIYQTQLVQARYARQIVETLRANNTINRGILLWSGNDFCPAAGFSMLDFQGRPKALFFYARRFWASVLICLGQTGPARNGYIVNDTPSPLTAQARFQLLDIKGGILDQSQSPVSVSPYSTASITLPRDLLNPVCPEKSILHMAVYQEEVLLSENTYLFTRINTPGFAPWIWISPSSPSTAGACTIPCKAAGLSRTLKSSWIRRPP